MFRFLEALPKTTLLYRSNPLAGKAELATLLIAGTALLIACRYPLGFQFSTNLILALLGQGSLMIGGLVFMVRGGQDAVEDSMKLSRLLLVTWTVVLILFVHNFFEPARVLYGLPGFARALVYAGAATLLMTIHTINQDKRERGGAMPSRTIPWTAITGGCLLLTLVMAVWLYAFVISESYSEQIRDLPLFRDEVLSPF